MEKKEFCVCLDPCWEVLYVPTKPKTKKYILVFLRCGGCNGFGRGQAIGFEEEPSQKTLTSRSEIPARLLEVADKMAVRIVSSH